MAASPATVVLVHGAFHGPWCWERVIEPLTERGIPVVAVDRRRGDPLRVVTKLSENAAIVREALDRVPGRVVLCGHSAGGPIITEAGDHPAVRHLVYIAGRMPRGEGDPLGSSRRSPSAPAHITLPDGSPGFDADAAAHRFYRDCDPATAAWAVAQLVPQQPPYDPSDAVPSVIAWEQRPSTYVVCAQDRALDPEFQREVSKRATSVVEWDTGHSPFLSQPELVVDLLERLARGAGDR